MMKALCIHCGAEIGAWDDYVYDLSRSKFVPAIRWMHAPEDGPDAYWLCDADLLAVGPSPKD